MTGGLGLTFDSRDRGDVKYLRSIGKWVLHPIDCADAEQFEKLVKYFVEYRAEDKDQMVRVNSTKGARTLTMGRGRADAVGADIQGARRHQTSLEGAASRLRKSGVPIPFPIVVSLSAA